MAEGKILRSGQPDDLVKDEDVRRLYLGERFKDDTKIVRARYWSSGSVNETVLSSFAKSVLFFFCF
jgi:hypothetical protein